MGERRKPGIWDKPNTRFNDFRDLEVWKNCRDIRRKIWVVCKELPGEEKHRLVD